MDASDVPSTDDGRAQDSGRSKRCSQVGHYRMRSSGSRLVGSCMVAGLLCLAFGCATTGNESRETDRQPPPEVTDQTVDDRPEVARNYQPRVDVDIEQANFSGLETSSYEEELSRSAVRCYNRAIRRSGVEMEGAVVYEVIVTRNGRVAGTDVMSTRLKDDGVETCVERCIASLRFDLPSQSRAVYRLFFRLDFYLEEIVADDPPV